MRLREIVVSNMERGVSPRDALAEIKLAIEQHERRKTPKKQLVSMQKRCAALAIKLGHREVAEIVLGSVENPPLVFDVDGDIRQLKSLIRQMAILASTNGSPDLIKAARRAENRLANV